MNCWAHARRYFFKAIASDPERAKEGLGHIGALFRIERSIAEASRKKRERIRAKHSRPVLGRFFAWCDAEWPALLEDAPDTTYALHLKGVALYQLGRRSAAANAI